MSLLQFQRLDFRARGIYVTPFEEAVPVRDDEDELRTVTTERLRNTLFGYWRTFASEHMTEVPSESAASADMLSVFLSAYVLILRRYKTLRRSSGREVEKYAIGIRVQGYDRTFQTWKEIAALYQARFLSQSQFYERLATTSLMVGLIARELELVGAGQMNAAEVLVMRQVQQQKAASKRHAENRAMKKEVFTWLDENMHRFPSFDKVATEISQKVAPIGFRAARDWVGDWNKLRSARTA